MQMQWYVAKILLLCRVDDDREGPWTCEEQIRVLRAADKEACAGRLGHPALFSGSPVTRVPESSRRWTKRPAQDLTDAERIWLEARSVATYLGDCINGRADATMHQFIAANADEWAAPQML